MPYDAPTNGVSDRTALRKIVGDPTPQIADKELHALDGYFVQFLSLCPFLCISSADAEGNQDVSPRGDPPGFVKALDERTILIPDRKGNRRVDTMRNILENPKVGLVLFVPGVEEVVRINGRAAITDDAAVLAGCEVNGSVPDLGIVVEIDDVFFHCAKAIMRSKLWDPETPIDRADFPSFGQIVRDQRNPAGDILETETRLQQEYRDRLY
ncbi:MAG: pyridoxamine 5'-phosphate oxidase family protein [Rhodospirillaceae bacterium]